MKICRNCGTKVMDNAKFCISCGSGELLDPDEQVSEYKRTCNQCGKTWHSLTSRENEIVVSIRQNKKPNTCNMCDANAEKDRKIKLNTLDTEIDRLKTCPECGSKDYTEEIIYYEKK